MSLARIPAISQPVSLEGLEPLLDRAFEVDYSPSAEVEMKPYQKPVFARSRGSGTPILSGDRSTSNGQLEGAISFLRSQLAYTRGELKEARANTRWLEAQIMVKDDQLKLMPPLFERAANLTVVERELNETRQQLTVLLEQYTSLQNQLEQTKSSWWWRIGQLLGLVA